MNTCVCILTIIKNYIKGHYTVDICMKKSDSPCVFAVFAFRRLFCLRYCTGFVPVIGYAVLTVRWDTQLSFI